MNHEEFILKIVKMNEESDIPTKTSHIIAKGHKKGITTDHIKLALKELHRRGVIYDPNEGTVLKNKYVRAKQ